MLSNAPDAEELAGGSAERDVRAGEVVHGRLREHGVVLKLRLAQGRAVSGNQDKLGYSSPIPCASTRSCTSIDGYDERDTAAE